MSDLFKRTLKYYLIQGLQEFALSIGLVMLLGVEWIALGSDELDLPTYVAQNFVTFNVMFLVMFNFLYSMYGPNWYDSIVLSMGARRKDVFWGEIVKQGTYILGSTITSLLVALIFKINMMVFYTLLGVVLAAIMGAIGIVLGYKVKKFGKVVIVLLILIAGAFGGIVAAMSVTGKSFNISGLGNGLTLPVIGLGAVILFVLLEVWAYNLNQKSMVS